MARWIRVRSGTSERGHPTMNSPKIKTAIHRKDFGVPLPSATVSRYEVSLTQWDEYDVFLGSACVVTFLRRQTRGRRFGFGKTTSPPMRGQKMKLHRSTSRFAHPHGVHWRTTWRFSHSKWAAKTWRNSPHLWSPSLFFGGVPLTLSRKVQATHLALILT